MRPLPTFSATEAQTRELIQARYTQESIVSIAQAYLKELHGQQTVKANALRDLLIERLKVAGFSNTHPNDLVVVQETLEEAFPNGTPTPSDVHEALKQAYLNFPYR